MSKSKTWRCPTPRAVVLLPALGSSSVAVPKPDGDAVNEYTFAPHWCAQPQQYEQYETKQEPVASSSRSIRSVSSRHSAYVSPGPPTRPVPAVLIQRDCARSLGRTYLVRRRRSTSQLNGRHTAPEWVPTSPNPPAGVRDRSLLRSFLFDRPHPPSDIVIEAKIRRAMRSRHLHLHPLFVRASHFYMCLPMVAGHPTRLVRRRRLVRPLHVRFWVEPTFGWGAIAFRRQFDLERGLERKRKGKAQDDETVSEPRSSRSNASTLRGRPVPFVIPGGPGHQTRKSTDTVTASTVSTIKPSVPPVPRLDQNSGVRGVTLNVGIPCLIISKRAKYKAYARYIGEVHGELGLADSWGSEKLGGRQWNDGSIGGIRYFEVGSSLPWDDGEERASRRRRLESVLSGKKRDMDTMSIDRDRMKRLRSVSPAMSDMSTTESRGLFVRPSDVIYVFDAVDDA
ncbi:CAP-Gly domain protein [Ceratobasidium sp. AG-Ba]|nr:CAP-Gly domain protein [Ceratobasidium sp. AG-Ba]